MPASQQHEAAAEEKRTNQRRLLQKLAGSTCELFGIAAICILFIACSIDWYNFHQEKFKKVSIPETPIPAIPKENIIAELCSSPYLSTVQNLSAPRNPTSEALRISNSDTSLLLSVNKTTQVVYFNETVVDLLLQAVGEKKLYILSAVGFGRNGKSTFLNQLARIFSRLDEDVFQTGAGAVAVTEGIWISNLLVPFKDGYLLIADCEGVGMDNKYAVLLAAFLTSLSSQTIFMIRRTPSNFDYDALNCIIMITEAMQNQRISFVFTDASDQLLKIHGQPSAIVTDGLSRFKKFDNLALQVKAKFQEKMFTAACMYSPSNEEINELVENSRPYTELFPSSTCYAKSFVHAAQVVIDSIIVPANTATLKEEAKRRLATLSKYMLGLKLEVDDSFERIAKELLSNFKFQDELKRLIIADDKCSMNQTFLETVKQDMVKNFTNSCDIELLKKQCESSANDLDSILTEMIQRTWLPNCENLIHMALSDLKNAFNLKLSSAQAQHSECNMIDFSGRVHEIVKEYQDKCIAVTYHVKIDHCITFKSSLEIRQNEVINYMQLVCESQGWLKQIQDISNIWSNVAKAGLVLFGVLGAAMFVFAICVCCKGWKWTKSWIP